MLYLFELLDQLLVGFLWIKPELGSIGDGWDDHGLIEQSEVRRGGAGYCITQHSESSDCGHPFLVEEGDMVFEGKFAV